MVVLMLCYKKLPELDLPDLQDIERAELEKLVSNQWPIFTQAPETSFYNLQRQNQMNDIKPAIITPGDPSGIGPEVAFGRG